MKLWFCIRKCEWFTAIHTFTFISKKLKNQLRTKWFKVQGSTGELRRKISEHWSSRFQIIDEDPLSWSNYRFPLIHLKLIYHPMRSVSICESWHCALRSLDTVTSFHGGKFKKKNISFSPKKNYFTWNKIYIHTFRWVRANKYFTPSISYMETYNQLGVNCCILDNSGNNSYPNLIFTKHKCLSKSWDGSLA